MLLAVTVTLDQYWLTMIISVFLPMIVALVTKQVASGGLKAVILLFLSAVTGTLTQIAAANGVFDLKDAIVATVMSFVIAVGIHFGLLSPTGLTGSEGKIQSKTANVGLG